MSNDRHNYLQAVIAFGPGYLSIDGTARNSVYSFDRKDILGHVRSFAVAGWLTSDDGSAFRRGALPTYLNGTNINMWDRTIHHHLRDDKTVFARLDEETWEDEWVE